MSRWILCAGGLACLAAYVFVYSTGRADLPIRSDGFSYYVYLPSWFIFHDPTLVSVARDCCGGEFPEFTAIIRWPETRRWVNAHPIGVAVMQSPFFVVADALTRWSNLSRDGFTLYYQHAAGLAGLAWTIAGLWVLSRLLRRHFTEGVTAATIGTVLFGTNLFHYATYDSSYSHAYSFFLIAALLDVTERWHRRPTRRVAALLGVIAGMIVLTRHTNALALVFVPLYGASFRNLAGHLRALMARARDLTVAALVAVAVTAPQLAMYYSATGRLAISSYGQLGFTFASPHFFGVLFSVQKGAFFWTPILLAGVAGFARRHSPVQPFLVPAVLFVALNTYVIASWWDWQFGGSFGHRGFVDMLPVFALGIAALYEWAAGQPIRRAAVSAIAAGATALCLIQTIQYWNRVIPMSDTTWEQYRESFLRLR
jgi:hypothetical protein